VVDDGSTDDTRSIARQYESLGVKVISQNNYGASAARNKAFAASSGEYVQYLDADDLLHPKKIAAQMNVLQHCRPRTVAVGPTCFFTEGESPQGGEINQGSQNLSSDDPLQWLVDLWTPGGEWGMVSVGAYLTPQKLIEEAGPWSERLTKDDDGEFFTRVLLQSERIQYVGGEAIYYYRHHSASRLSGMSSKKDFESLLMSIDKKRENVLPLTSAETRDEAAYALARSYWNLAVRAYPIHSDIVDKAIERARALGYDRPSSTSVTVSRTIKGRVSCRLFGWRVARYLQYGYRRLRELIF